MLLPVLYGGTVGLVTWLVLLKAQATASWPAWLTSVVTLAVGLVVGGAAAFLLLPCVSRSLKSIQSNQSQLGKEAEASQAADMLPIL